MKIFFYKIALISCLLLTKGIGQDASFVQQVFFEVVAINSIQINQINRNGPAPCFRICGLCDNFEFPPIFYSELSYNVITNEANKKIIAVLDREMAPGCQLFLQLAPPCGARSLGMRALSSIPNDLVIELTRTSGVGLSMLYLFTATPGAGVIPPQMRTVILTLTDS